ncbi:hypothetical protein K502DRAFT_37678 [Neoconidiobolus thromboides FSU 785]|nr:hypothetical protein K502DRAFT_37678 [Neoconidiobolus thromboides FSU 785]
MINPFGFRFVNYSDTMALLESSDKTQMIDTQTWENVESLPPLLKGNTTTSNDSNDYVGNNNLGAIIGGSIGGIVGFLLLFGIFFIFYRGKLKKERLPSIITDPIFIDTNIHLDSTNKYRSNKVFPYFQQADGSTARLTGNLNLTQMINMDMIK